MASVNRHKGANIFDNAILGTVKRTTVKFRPDLLAAASEVDSGIDLPSKAIVRDVWIDVITKEDTGTTKTIDVGLLASESGGNADGFIDGASVATAGVVQADVTTSDGSNVRFFQSTTRGVFLANFQAGSDSLSDRGMHYKINHNGDSVTAKSLSATAGSSDFAELVVDIYVTYDQILSL